MFLRLAFREILNNKSFFALFILNLSLGLLGLTAVEIFRASIDQSFAKRSKLILGADLEIGGRSLAEPGRLQEAEKLLPPFKVLETKRLYSILRRDDAQSHRLVQIWTQPPGFPFYGGFVLTDDSHPLHEKWDNIWLYYELAQQLNLQVGDSVQLGRQTFQVAGLVREDPQQGLAGATLAPRVFITPLGLERTGLVNTGSLIWHSRFYKFLEAKTPDRALLSTIQNIINDPSIRVVTPIDASEQLARGLNYVGDFLGLVSLVALFLASIGIFYLYRSFLYRRVRDMAIYRTLGLSATKVSFIYLAQLMVLGAAGSITGLSLGYVSIMAFQAYFEHLLGGPFEFALSKRLLAIVFMTGVGGTVLLSIPLLSRINRVKPASIFQANLSSEEKIKGRFYQHALWLPWCCWFAFLAIVVSHSYRIGLTFFAIFLVLALAILPIVSSLLKTAVSYGRDLHFRPRMALLYAGRFNKASASTFLAISFSALLLTLIPLIRASLVSDLKTPHQERPSLFLFDIQEDQLAALAEYARSLSSPVMNVSPMVRGRLSSVNGQPFDSMTDRETTTREEEQQLRFRNRGLNLTYRSFLDDSEEIIAGQFFSGSFQGLQDEIGEVSIEQRYAARMGIGLGDILEIEVFEIPVRVRVTSIRRVRWTSFMPNFFLVLQPGLIDDAPAVYLAALGEPEDIDKVTFYGKFLQKFPTISMIDLERLVERIVEVTDQMMRALALMTLLALLVGALVLYSVMSHQMEMKRKDIVLLKAMGIDFNVLKSIFRLEFVSITILSAITGSMLGILVAWFISYRFFDAVWEFDALLPAAVISSISIFSFIICEICLTKVIHTPCNEMLKEGQLEGYFA